MSFKPLLLDLAMGGTAAAAGIIEEIGGITQILIYFTIAVGAVIRLIREAKKSSGSGKDENPEKEKE